MDLLQAFGWLALAMAALMLGGWRWERAHRNAGIVDVLWATGMGLAAVFLALAVGVVLGSGLFADTVLSGLRNDKAELRTEIETLTDEKNELNEKLSAAGEFDALMAPRMLRDTLRGTSV